MYYLPLKEKHNESDESDESEESETGEAAEHMPQSMSTYRQVHYMYVSVAAFVLLFVVHIMYDKLEILMCKCISIRNSIVFCYFFPLILGCFYSGEGVH